MWRLNFVGLDDWKKKCEFGWTRQDIPWEERNVRNMPYQLNWGTYHFSMAVLDMQIFLHQQMLYRDFSVILSTGLAKNRLTNWSFNCFSIEYQENWRYITIHIATLTLNYIETHRFYAYCLPLKGNSTDFDTLKYYLWKK